MTDWVEITALVAGPVLAVGLTLWRENVRQERERKLGVMRQLLVARANVGDPAFSTAMNLVPIEFGHVEAVMTAWENFSHAAGQQKATKEQVDALVKEMMLSLGYTERAASQVARDAYTANALSDQRKLAAGVLKSVVSIAASTRLSAQAAVAVANHVTGKKLPPLPDEPDG